MAKACVDAGIAGQKRIVDPGAVSFRGPRNVAMRMLMLEHVIDRGAHHRPERARGAGAEQ